MHYYHALLLSCIERHLIFVFIYMYTYVYVMCVCVFHICMHVVCMCMCITYVCITSMHLYQLVLGGTVSMYLRMYIRQAGRHDWFYYTSTKCAIPDDMDVYYTCMYYQHASTYQIHDASSMLGVYVAFTDTHFGQFLVLTHTLFYQQIVCVVLLLTCA